MRPTLIDLNDVELRITRGTDELARSPGYATLVNQKVEIGDKGFAHAWLLPRQSYNRYWQALNTAPLTRLGKRVRHAGDLAYLHLELLRERGGRPSDAIFIVPSAYHRAQLSLLLGIAQAAGLTVKGLVDSAVAVGAILPPGHYTHVEASLYHTNVTQIRVDDRRALRTHTEVVPDTGISHFEQRIISCIVEAFLRGCRFDALHDAATEQLLHTHLAEWLALLAERPEITISLEYRGARHEARLHRDSLAAAIAPLRRTLSARVGAGIALLDYRLGGLPGITLEWPTAQILPAHAALTGCTYSPELHTVTGGGVTLRTELAVVPVESRFVPVQAQRLMTQGATHLLVQHVAYPLSTLALHLTARGTVLRAPSADSVGSVVLDGAGARLEVARGATLMLNGQRVTGSARLAPGDHLSVAGAACVFVPITVRDDDAI